MYYQKMEKSTACKFFVKFILLFIVAGLILSDKVTIVSAVEDVCKSSTRTIHYDVAAIDVAIPLNGWGDLNPQGMIYALNNQQSIPNVENIKDPGFKLYNTTDMTLPDKIMPLVLRANVNDCIEVTLTNRLSTANPRNVGMQVTGLPFNPNQSDGAFTGRNNDTTVAPEGSGGVSQRTYRWFANRTGGFMFRDISNSQFPQDTINKGLYGMVIVEQENSTWFDSVTGRNFLLSNPQQGIGINDHNYTDAIPQGTDTITGKPIYIGVGANIFASVHQQACRDTIPWAGPCERPLPEGTMLYENVSGNDYRSYALFMQDEMEGIIGPVAWFENGSIAAFGKPFFPATGLQDEIFLLNYKSEPLRNREGAWERHRGEIPTKEVFDAGGIKVQGGLKTGTPGNPNVDIILPDGNTITVNASNMTVILPNGRKFGPTDNFCGEDYNTSDNSPNGPMYKYSACVGEEAHLQSWPFGDPATALPRAYWGDPIVVYAATASAHETHTFHQHTHRWLHDPDQANISSLPVPETLLQTSNRLDVQGIGPGEVFKLVYEQGAGSQMGTAGDSIFHCHLYPHFAGGLWSALRVFDKLRINFTDGSNINATLFDGTPLLYPDNTQEAVLVPLPAKLALINTTDPDVKPGSSDTGDFRRPAPRGMPNRTATIPNGTHPGYPNFIAGKYGLKSLQPPKFIIDPENITTYTNPTTGKVWNISIPIGDRAVPTELEENASYNGISPGIMLADPCAGPNNEFGSPDRPPDRIYQPVAIQVPFIQNARGGFFNPEQRAYVEKENVAAVKADPGKLKPYSWRANVGDCVEFHATNALQPDKDIPTLGKNDGIFHGLTNTPEVSNHIHIIRFDQLGSDGTSVNWNYDISQKIGETASYRIFADINGRTVFNHDHQFPTSHQQGGLYAAFIIEPRNSTYLKPDGTLLGPATASKNISNLTASRINVKGVGTAANILVRPLTTNDKKKGISGGGYLGFREFAVLYSDFTPTFIADPVTLKAAFEQYKIGNTAPIFNPALRQKPYNPPFDPDEYGADQGTTTLNYKIEPFQARINLSNASATAAMKEPAYIFSSRVWGDPETEVFRAYMNDPVVIRLMDGAHEEHHTFELHGHRWLHQPSDPDSFLTDNQASNIGEWFNFELQGNVNKTPPGQFKQGGLIIAGLPGDYLFGSFATNDLWNGMWGMFRVENGQTPTLAVLPGAPKPQVVAGLGLLGKNVTGLAPDPVTPGLTNGSNPCPVGAPVKRFNIVAMNNSTIYNNVYGENDPFGLMYVLAEDEQKVKTGEKKPEPLVLRANQGDCIEVNLTNHLPDLAALAAGKDVIFPNGTYSSTSLDPNTLQHYGDAQVNAILPAMSPDDVDFFTLAQPFLPIGGTQIGMHRPNPVFSFVQWPMSNRTSLHPHLVKLVASVGDGATVGFMRDQTVGPGENITYIWFADKELGATLLDGYGDIRSQRHHGMFAGLIIEPNGSKYIDPGDLTKEINNGTSAVIKLKDGTMYREFVPLFADGLNLRNSSNSVIPDLIGPPTVLEVNHQPCSPEKARCEDVEDQGESGINYRTERLQNRAPLALDPVLLMPTEELFNPGAYKAFSSTEFQDPETPVFEAFVGEPVVFRPMVPGDLARVRTIGLSGHVWQHEPNDPGTNTVDSEGSFGVGKSFNFWFIGGAGGEQRQPGDYMYNNRNNAPEDGVLPGGHWGLIRVFNSTEAAGIQPIPPEKRANLHQVGP
ncbi:MAG: hypothetical protein WA130_02720 [Candidatus Methanoperedens sp.]